MSVKKKEKSFNQLYQELVTHEFKFCSDHQSLLDCLKWYEATIKLLDAARKPFQTVDK